MERLTAQLRSLAAEDAAVTDPTPASVERGWTRLCGALAVPVAAPVGVAAAKKVAGAIALVVLGLSAAAAPAAIDRPIAHVEPVTAAAPSALAPRPVPTPRAFAAAPPPSTAPPPRSEPPRRRPVVDPLVAELRTLANARAHLEAGRFRQALGAARKLLRSPTSQLGPEARAIEAIAACELALPHAVELAARYHQQHASSPHRKRVTAACKH
jgi:hypothetical protein